MDSNNIAVVLLILALALSSDLVQCHRIARSVNPGKDLQFEVTKSPSQNDDYHGFGSLPDFNKLVKSYNSNLKKNETLAVIGSEETLNDKWHFNKVFAEKLMRMRSISKLTDCTFVVGDDGNTVQKFDAHMAVLAAASPVFEAVFENSRNVRVRGWKPEEFASLLNFMYAGNLCIDNFDAACTLLRHASSLKLNSVHKAARGFLFYHMYPNQLFKAFLCAKKAEDYELMDSAAKLMGENATQTFKDSLFYELAKDDLARLLARDDLNVQSEVEVFEAVSRWGLMRVKKEGKTPTHLLIREIIGPAVLKQIRFLTMTAAEFSRVHRSTQLLTYEEGLLILFSINSPGILEMPSSLCPLTQKRNNSRNANDTFKIIDADQFSCEGNSLNATEIFDLYSTSYIPNGNNVWRIVAIQIPKSIEARYNCQVVEEFDVIVLNSKDETVQKFSFNMTPSCTTLRYKFASNGNYNDRIAVDDSYVMNVKFENEVYIPYTTQKDRYKLKIVLKGQKSYPFYVDAGQKFIESKNLPTHEIGRYDSYHIFGRSTRYRLMYNPAFVYAIFTL